MEMKSLLLCSNETLPKAQRTWGLSSAYQSNMFRSYHKFKHKSWSNFIFIISSKWQLQNLNQTSAFRLNLNFKILTKPSFRISIKIKLHNLNQGSAAKYWPNFSFKSCMSFNFKILTKPSFRILTKIKLHSLHQASTAKYWPKFSFKISPEL